MKPPKITPGEWNYRYNGHFHEMKTDALNRFGNFIYLLDFEETNGISKDEAKANAKAVSAVPDMIEALIEMATVWHNDVYHHFYHLYDQDAEKARDRADNDENYQMMINALKKAGCTNEK